MFMRQRFHPPATLAIAGQTLTLATQRPLPLPATRAPAPRRGKLDYLGGPRRAPVPARSPASPRVLVRQVLGQGRYIGGAAGRILAFVWLEESGADEAPAANDPDRSRHESRS
jgi:hypothetical protein